MDLYVVLWLVLVIAPISTFLHEGGHALGAKWRSADRIYLAIGSGKQMVSFSWKQMYISLHTLFFIGGVSYNERNYPYKRSEIIFISLCGPISNGFTAALTLFLVGFSWAPVRAFILFNLWLLIINLIPFKVKGKQSDGYTIMKAFSGQHSRQGKE